MTKLFSAFKNRHKGQAMIIAIIFFLWVSLTIILGLTNPVIRHISMATAITISKESFYTAEAGMEDVIFRLKSGKPVSSSQVLMVNDHTVTTNVSDSLNGKTVTSVGEADSYYRKVETKLALGTGASFFYGLQTGTGGIQMSNNSKVIGNVYSNGDISGSNGASITGSAYAANLADPVADQVNDSPVAPPNNIIFGANSSQEDIAQSFVPSTTNAITGIKLYLKKVSTPSNLTIRITSDNNGNPGGTIAQGSISSSLVTGSFGWIDASLSSNPVLTSGVTYWLVVDGTSNASKYYIVGANSNYPSGIAKIGKYGGSWNVTTPSDLDYYFKIYLGGNTSVINNVIVGSGSSGNAHAHTVTNSNIAGSLYCQTGSGNNKACDTSLPDPTPEPFPISDANIAEWKAAAESGGVTNGNVIIDGTTSSIGPQKIIGNLTLSNNAVLNITGTLWVTGNIITSNGSIIKLSASYGTGSGVVVTDGYVNISNNATFAGSGQNGSYLMLVSDLSCPGGSGCNSDNAIDVSNNAGTVVLNAQKAGIHFSNNAGAKSAVAKKIELDNGAIITYENGLINVNFYNGPSGGFDISSWKEVE